RRRYDLVAVADVAAVAVESDRHPAAHLRRQFRRGPAPLLERVMAIKRVVQLPPDAAQDVLLRVARLLDRQAQAGEQRLGGRGVEGAAAKLPPRRPGCWD